MSAVIASSKAVSMNLATEGAENINVRVVPPLYMREELPGRHVWQILS